MLDPDEFPYVVRVFDVNFPGTDLEELVPYTEPYQFKQREEALREIEIWRNTGQGRVVRAWKIQAVPLEQF